MIRKIFLNKDQRDVGVMLCLNNAYRLTINVELLLDSFNASSSLAYSLWSLAMEEYGKALLLRELKKDNDNKFEMKQEQFFGGGSHDLKFNIAKKALPLLPDKIRTEIRVKNNASCDNILIKGKNSASSILIGSGATGTFIDTSNRNVGEPLSLGLRFRDLYVGWDSKDNEWQSPDPLLSISPVLAEELLSGDDVKRCIEILKEKLKIASGFSTCENMFDF